MHVGAVELGGLLLVEPDDADLAGWIVRCVPQDRVQQFGRGAAALMHGDDIGLHAHAGGRTEIDAGGLEGGGDRFQCLPARRRRATFDGLDGGDGHAGGAGKIGLAPFEQGAGGTYLSVVDHGVRISF